MLAPAIPGECLETIARRNAQIGNTLGRIQSEQTAQGDICQMIQAFHKAAFEQSLRVEIAERLDHDAIIGCYTSHVKRKAANAP